MRILAGEFKNRLIEVPKKAILRPTSSKMRAQVFNICQNIVADSVFLDLFSGTGAMGLEALSQGASFSCFVDHDFDVIQTIKKSITNLGIDPSAYRCIQSDVLTALPKIEKEIENKRLVPFDIIFIDPPYFQKEKAYEKSIVAQILSFLDQSSQIAKESTRMFIEESRFAPIESIQMNHWKLKEKRGTGDSILYEFIAKKDLDVLK